MRFRDSAAPTRETHLGVGPTRGTGAESPAGGKHPTRLSTDLRKALLSAQRGQCPSAAELVAYRWDRPGSLREAEILHHLTRCRRCTRLLFGGTKPAIPTSG